MNTLDLQFHLGLACLCYAVISFVFDAFEDISGGRVRKLEETDPEFSRKLEQWLEHADVIHTFFKLLLFMGSVWISALLNILAKRIADIYQLSPVWTVVAFGAAAVLLLTGITDSAAKLLLPRYDLAILRGMMPTVVFLAQIFMYPFGRLYRYIDHRNDLWFAKSKPDGMASVEDEILNLMEDEPDNNLEEGEKRMIKGIFELQDMSVKEIMTPRVDMTALPLSATVEEAKELIISSGHSRIPVYGRSVDEIKGIIYAKDFLAVSSDKRTLGGLSHPPVFIPETKAVDELLDEFKRAHNHFAVIIDEYGGTSGIVTFEDIIEEIVGDVRDEYDPDEDADRKPQLLPDGSVQLEARTPVSDVNEILDIDIPDSEHADTIGGYICAELGHIPEVGEIFTAPGLFTAVIVKADKRKIQTLKLSVTEEENE